MIARRGLPLAVCALLLPGCSKPITNDVLVAEVKKCQAAGLGYERNVAGINREVVGVVCTYPTQSTCTQPNGGTPK